MHFTPTEGPILDLLGQFGSERRDLKGTRSPQTIVGISEKGEDVTLIQGRPSGSSFKSRGIDTERYAGGTLIIGKHFSSPEAVRLSHYNVRFSSLENWLDRSNIQVEFSRDYRETTIRHVVSEPIILGNTSQFDIKVGYAAETPILRPVVTEAIITEHSYFRLGARQLKAFEDFRRGAWQLRQFLTLAVGAPVHAMWVSGHAGLRRKQGDGTYTGVPVEFYYKVPHPPSSVTHVSWNDMRFRYSDVEQEIGTLLENWFNQSERLEPVLNLYFATIFNPHLYLENRFLLLAQAVESFHRRTTPNIDVPPEKHEERVKAILESVPEEHRKWIEGRFGHNEPHFRRRVEELTKPLKKHKELLGGSVGRFTITVVETRNYYTHFDERLRDRIPRGTDLFWLTRRLQRLLEVCLLTQLGLNVDRSVAIVKRCAEGDLG